MVTATLVTTATSHTCPASFRLGNHDVRLLDMNNYDFSNDEVAADTFQNGMSFDNVVRIAPNSGAKVYKYQAGKPIREIKPEGYATTKLYSKKEGSSTVQAVQAGA